MYIFRHVCVYIYIYIYVYSNRLLKIYFQIQYSVYLVVIIIYHHQKKVWLCVYVCIYIEGRQNQYNGSLSLNIYISYIYIEE